LQAAIAWHGEVSLPLEHSETLLAYGAFLRRSGRPAAARPGLAQAGPVADAAGAGWLAGLAGAELKVDGGRLRQRAASGALTAQEERVARLAASGAANAEIARQGVLAGAAHNPQLASDVLGDLLHGFFVLTGWVLGVALVVLVIAVLAGPYRWAAAIRSWVRRIGGAREGDRRGAAGWMGLHAAGFQLAGAVAAGILLLIVSVSWLSFLIIGVLLAACEIGLEQIKPAPPDETSPTSGPDSQAGTPPRISET
jgi:hypothetical protein